MARAQWLNLNSTSWSRPRVGKQLPWMLDDMICAGPSGLPPHLDGPNKKIGSSEADAGVVLPEVLIPGGAQQLKLSSRDVVRGRIAVGVERGTRCPAGTADSAPWSGRKTTEQRVFNSLSYSNPQHHSRTFSPDSCKL